MKDRVCRGEGATARQRELKRPQNAWMTECVFARVCKGTTPPTHPHDRLLITQGTAQFRSYYESMALARRLERCITPRYSRNSEQTREYHRRTLKNRNTRRSALREFERRHLREPRKVNNFRASSSSSHVDPAGTRHILNTSPDEHFNEDASEQDMDDVQDVKTDAN